MYERFIKRSLDFVLSLIALIILLPLFFTLMIIGTIMMRDNPFFVQERPGKKGKDGKEQLFHLIKFRTMSNLKDKNGKLLPDKERLNFYGKFLRSTSLDELPELINILNGDMSIVGPRPLLVQYLPYYTEKERHRHDIRPGLTGLAQVNGRNALNWEKRFKMDVYYVNNITMKLDFLIIKKTIISVINKDGIILQGLEDFDEYRRKQRNSDTNHTNRK